MSKMLNVYDRSTRKKTAVLQNAFNIVETQEINQIYSLSFTLPYDDDKNKYCLPRHFVRYGDQGELYRIKSPKTSENNTSTVTYECEHVITTLCDDIMFGSFVYGGRGVYTTNTINWLLNQQKTKNWRLGSCAFSRQFEYNWEQENLLNALYSIPKEFAASYMWTFDTVSYPWTINLIEIDKTATPEYYLRAKSNILSSGSSADYANICTRIYPLGYGEGVNQLTIRDATVTNVVKSGNVNVNGVPSETSTTKYGNTYIQSPQAYIDKYGIVEKVLVDRKFEQATTLFGYAKSMLEVYQEPKMSRSFDVTDLYPITNKPLDDAQVGKICKMTHDGTVAYITKTIRRWDQAGNLQINLSTKASDIASNVADLADRIRIESVYAQGATQLYQHSKDANAAPVIDNNGNITRGKGMVIPLYFPSEMKQINKVLLKLELKKFRSYSSTTSDAGGISKTTADGGATSRTTADGGATSRTTADGGATSTTTSSGGGTSTTTYSGGGTSTSTASGGGTGTTSTSGADVSGSGDTDTIWEGNSGTFQTEELTASWAEETEDADGSVGEHRHSYYPYYPSLYGSLYQLSHSHSFGVNCGSHSHSFSVPSHTHEFSVPNHTHGFSVPNHTHGFSVPDHRHEFTIPNHRHEFSIPNHKHEFTIPSHKHNIIAGIYEASNTPTAFDIYVGNTKKATVNSTSYAGDITQWILNDKNTISRNTWINVEIVPNDLAYVQASVFVQGFVQSRGGGNY